MQFQIIIPIFIISQGTIWKSALFRGVFYKKLIRWSVAGELQKCVNVIQITHSTMIFARNKLHFQQLMILSSRFRCTLSAWYWCQGNRLKIPILRCFWGYMLLWDTIKMLFLLYSMRLSRLKYSDNKYTHYSFWDKMINRQVECRNLLSFVKMHKRGI